MTPEAPGNYCSECGQAALPEEMARFGDRLVCSNCKNVFAQRLREGVAPGGGVVRYGGFWLRFVAACIDGLIIAIPVGILQSMALAVFGLSMATPAADARPEDVLRALGPMFGVAGL